MIEWIEQGIKLHGLLAVRLDQVRQYLVSFNDDNLLQPYLLEAGRLQITYLPKEMHDGWDSPLSPLRGTVTGHWLSAVAQLLHVDEDPVLAARAARIVHEIALCQEEHGNGWCFSIPEKSLVWLKRGKRTWAPFYVCHKTLMGLLDMYLYTENTEALEIIIKASRWFTAYIAEVDDALMETVQEEEFGAMMELFADIYAVTQDPEHLDLMRRFEKKSFFSQIEQEENPLINQHANSTIPLIHGACRAYEVTGEERYRRIAERYWQLAVEINGSFCTGGHTGGEIWTPPGAMMGRLGNNNQEHCMVYNMMRLAMYLFAWTGESHYADYWEQNFYNGILAQGFKPELDIEQLGGQKNVVPKDMVAYYLPLGPGSKKYWGSRFHDFWCCHCTLLQANAFLYRGLYSKTENTLYVNQYQESDLEADIGTARIRLSARNDYFESAWTLPEVKHMLIDFEVDEPVTLSVALRLPEWQSGSPVICIDGEPVEFPVENGYALLYREWSSISKIEICIPMRIYLKLVDDRKSKAAFCIGPMILAGLTPTEVQLTYQDRPESLLEPVNGRMWDNWSYHYITTGQLANVYFKPIWEIADEVYTVYFPIQKSEM